MPVGGVELYPSVFALTLSCLSARTKACCSQSERKLRPAQRVKASSADDNRFGASGLRKKWKLELLVGRFLMSPLWRRGIIAHSWCCGRMGTKSCSLLLCRDKMYSRQDQLAARRVLSFRRHSHPPKTTCWTFCVSQRCQPAINETSSRIVCATSACHVTYDPGRQAVQADQKH